MRVCVLGGDGFIGSHVVEELLAQGCDVSVVGRFPYQRTHNLEAIRSKIRIFHADITNPVQLEPILKGQEVVYHFATNSNPVISWNNPVGELDTHVKPSVAVFEACARAGVAKLVYASSGGTVYGPAHEPIGEGALPQPFSPYGIAKIALEYYLNHFRHAYGMQFDVYRMSNVYGPRQNIANRQGVIATWFYKLVHAETLEVYGDHDTLRDYIHVKDVGYLMTHSLKNLDDSLAYNLGSGRGVSIMELLEIFRQAVGRELDVLIMPRRASDVASIVLDNSRLMAHFPDYAMRELDREISQLWETDFRQLAADNAQ